MQAEPTRASSSPSEALRRKLADAEKERAVLVANLESEKTDRIPNIIPRLMDEYRRHFWRRPSNGGSGGRI